jgi:site-specific recombinase XerD
MLESYFVKPTTIDRLNKSWIAQSIEEYVRWLVDQGHAGTTVRQRIPLLFNFGEYAQKNGAQAITDLPNLVSDFVRDWKIPGHYCRSESRQKVLCRELRGVLRQMLSVVLPDYKYKSRSRRTCVPRFAFTDKFYAHLIEERGLSKATMRVYDWSLGVFQSYVDRIELNDLSQLSPAILNAFVVDVKDRLGKSSLIRILGPLRTMLRYLLREGLLKQDFSECIELPRTYELSNLPRSISWQEVQMMLDAVDRRTPVGRRDYAVLLLLVSYGLRAREVSAITLDDIDWKNERLRIRGRKSQISSTYPLSNIVGDAILEYLKKDRPKTKSRMLFCRIKAPVGVMSYQSISGRSAHYLRLAGINIPHRGSHTLRHTCVQRLVEARFSLKQIGDYVGHRSPDSTRIYSKVDVESLRQLSLGLGEDLL